MREFSTGATRDTDEGKLDYEGFLSPLVLRRFAEYMHMHRLQADGKLRDSDNWQKGIPQEAYMKSLFRHFMDTWLEWREKGGSGAKWEEALCAMLFNVQGLLHETLSAKAAARQQVSWAGSLSLGNGLGRDRTLEDLEVCFGRMAAAEGKTYNPPSGDRLVPESGCRQIKGDSK